MKKNIATGIGALLASISISVLSCSMLFGSEEAAPEVESVSPERRLPPGEEISLRFSTGMDKESVENHFSLTGVQGRVKGVYSWSKDGRELSFAPESIEQPYSYILTIEAARSDGGAAMESGFRHVFSTLPELPSLEVASSTPADEAEEVSPESDIRLEFSRSVDRESFYRSLAITPSLPVQYNWNNGDKTVVVRAAERLAADTLYRISLTTECCDNEGVPLGEEFSLSFSTAAGAAFELVSIESDSMNAARDADTGSTYSLEKEDAIRFGFNRPVSSKEREGLMEFSPDIPRSLSWNEAGDSVEITFDEFLEWEGVYVISVGDEDYTFICNGEASRPIEVVELHFCNDISEDPPVFERLEQNIVLAPEDSSSAAIDVLLSHADGGELSPTSLLGALSLQATNGCAFIVLNSLEIEPASPPPASGTYPAEGTFTTVRVHFSLQIGTSSGRLIFGIHDELCDSLGNSLEEAFFLGVNI